MLSGNNVITVASSVVINVYLSIMRSYVPSFIILRRTWSIFWFVFMGNTLRRAYSKMSDPEEISRHYFEIAGINGYFLQEIFIPEEILILILSYVHPRELVFSCRRVCKVWCNLIDRDVLRIKCARKNVDIRKLNDIPWFVCFWILTKKFLDRNLVKNGCGQDNLANWEILSSGGDQWKVECPPQGSPVFPGDGVSQEILKSNSCFATSYQCCSKKQVIDLKAEGAIPYFMDNLRPLIKVSEWYCGRFDCRSMYHLKVTLLDENADAIDEFEIQKKNLGGTNENSWEQVNHIFDSYSAGVRFIEFFHFGMDSQFWQGHYGSKMTGASVILSLP